MFYAPINVKPAGGGGGGGGRQGIGRGFDFFAKNVVKFPTPGLKFCVKSTKKSPPRASESIKTHSLPLVTKSS